MVRKVVAVMDTMQQKKAIFDEIKSRGYKEEDITIIGQDADDAHLYARFFEQGQYVVTVDMKRDAGNGKAKYERTLLEPKTPRDHHHFPHHQMRRGL
ncbi:hypothetical protein [Evansella halocellulosilytica]|uniref:hypothetical protein n=1 Tax=Evansella halocellulosilytica TaxID=2011013 RepID=UPI000BB6E83B|nr:hypothetical protein [Evansella halocellulosilytica]